MASGFFERTLGGSNQLNGPDTVLAIGNFDGVHRGHQAVLERAITLAKEQGLKACALSFEPHPRTLFKPQSPVFRLTPSSQKARVLEAFGPDGLFVLPFTRDIAGTDADTFVKNYLVDQSSAKHVVTGFNFHFGKTVLCRKLC